MLNWARGSVVIICTFFGRNIVCTSEVTNIVMAKIFEILSEKF
jgi:hypothetical protein